MAASEEGTTIYSWDGGTETGGTATGSDDGLVGAKNASNTTIKLDGKADFSSHTVTITLDKALSAGDKISVTAYRNKNDVDKTSGFKAKFENGESTVASSTGLEFVNIDTSDASAEDSNRGTDPNTCTFEVPSDAAGSKTITMTRSHQGTNLFITKIVITTSASNDEGGETAQDITAKWDFTSSADPRAVAFFQGNSGNVASDVDGIGLTVDATSGKFDSQNRTGDAQVNSGTIIKIPVKNAKDKVTIVGNYQVNYTIGTEESVTDLNKTYEATAADATAGFVTITATGSTYFYSITVTQYAPKGATTLDDEAVSVTFPFNLGTAGQKATFTNADYWISSKVELGNNMGYAQTRTLGDATFTKIQPQTTAAAAAAEDYVLFRIQPKFGFTFIPKAVSLKAYKDGTGNGQLTIKWVTADGTETEIASNVDIQRNNADPAYSSLSYTDLSKILPYEGFCGLKVYIGGNLATTKQVGLSDIVIEGTLSGTEKEVPVLGSFKINGKEYTVEDVFGDQYEADLKLSKKEDMISSSNPLTDITPISGEVGTVTYEGTETSCTVTIPMIGGQVGLNYILNITQKPDYALTYYDVEGNALENKQTIEEDSKIGEFIYDIAGVKATKEGYKARGWFKNNYVGAKHSVDDVVTSDLNLYAVETEIEVASPSKKYEFDLTDINFDAADHEAFTPTGGTPNVSDMSHGWNFKEGNTIDLLVGQKASIIITTCKYPTGGTTKIVTSNGKEVEAISASDGATQAIEYEGEGGALTLTISGGQCYIHKIVIFNTSETNYDQKGQWIYVKPGDASSLLDAIDAANGMSGTERVFIYVPNGTYDLGQTTLTTIGRNNISIIGESMEGTIIKNRPVKEGIAITATLLNTATNTYLQDLTLDCIAPYGTGDDTKSAERGVCLQDKGTNTICKNVYLKGLQDTYYSNGSEGMTAYFETSKIEGTVDFICGSGSILFNECDLYVADRTQSKTSANVITAPATYASEKGYAFYGCTIDGTDNQKDKYNLGRPWQKSPAATYVNTTMKINASSAGWTSMNKADAIRFHEFNTKDATGSEVKSHNVNACETSGTKDALYLTEEQAANYAPDKFFTSWTPEIIAKQVDAPTDAKFENGTITWTAVAGAAGYAIFADDVLLAIVGADVTSYVIETAYASRRAGGDAPVYTIRTVNTMGGFGEAREITIVTGINKVNANLNDEGNLPTYNLNGQRVDSSYKGVVIKNGKKVVIK